jgi:hypothetical protein
MAALFDALMFLSVMSVVSVTVLVAFSHDGSPNPDVQSYVERAHTVLLGATLRSWSESSDKFMPVSDALGTLLCVKKALPERIHSEIESMLHGLFSPLYLAEWRCWSGEHCYVFGDGLGNATGGNIFVSSLSVAAPSGICTYVLSVRYA